MCEVQSSSNGLGLNLQSIKTKRDKNIEHFANLPTDTDDYQIDEELTSKINFECGKLGGGHQGSVYGIIDNTKLVAKVIRLKTALTITNSLIEDIVPSYYASNIGVGPKIHGVPFITTEGKYVAFIMDKVLPYEPIENDAQEIIDLYNISINNKLVSFDHEFAKTLYSPSRIIFLDLGVSSIYELINDALRDAVENDVFDDVGCGYYNKNLEQHFMDKYNKL